MPFMAGVAAEFLFVVSLFRLWAYRNAAGMPVREYRCRTGAACFVLLSALGLIFPFVPYAGMIAAAAAGTIASILFFAGIVGFEFSLALLFLIHQFPRLPIKHFFAILLLVIIAAFAAALLLPGAKPTLSFAAGSFSLALCGLCLFIFAYLVKRKKPRQPFMWGSVIFLALGLVFFLPPGRETFFWPAVFLAYLLLEHRLFSAVPAAPLYVLPQPAEVHSVEAVKPASAEAAIETAAEPVSAAPETSASVVPEAAEDMSGVQPAALSSQEDAAEDTPINGAVSRVPAGKPPEELPGTVPSVGSFIPREFLAILHKKTIADLKLGDHIKQEMTIFFSDIRQFTDLSENLTPEESFAFINSYLSRIVPEITRNGGFVDKYIGDAILALFPQNNGADMAVRTAISIQGKILEYNSHRANCGYRSLAMGIGIHTGTLMVGVVGTKDRMQSTVISDAVNLASRVESLTKAFRVSLAISEETFKKLDDPGSYQYRFVGKVRVKGKSEPVSIFEIFDGIDEKLQTKKIKANRFFEQGMFLYYQKKYADALLEFRRVLEVLPDDGAAAFYIDNCMTKIK